jgi:hypothetical protein
LIHAAASLSVLLLGVVVYDRRRHLLTLAGSRLSRRKTQYARVACVIQSCRKRDRRRLTMSGNKPAVVTGPHPEGGWQNKVEGKQRASNVFPTKAEAQARGREMAQERHTEHKIQDKHGQITERNSYGHDPRSRKG